MADPSLLLSPFRDLKRPSLAGVLLCCLALEALKIPSPQGLVFYSVPPALTGPASLGSFSIVQLLVLALWGESGYSDGCTPYT